MTTFFLIVVGTLLFHGQALSKASEGNKKIDQLSGSICFIKKGDLFSANLGTKQVEQLTNNQRNSQPAWSLDGSSIFFLSTSEAKPQQVNVYQYHLKTKTLMQLTELGGVCGHPYTVHKDSVIFWHSLDDPNSAKPDLKLTTKAVLLDHSDSDISIKRLTERLALKLNNQKHGVMYDPTTIYKGFYVVKNGKIVKDIQRVKGMLGNPAWSPDNRYVAYQNAPDINILDTETGSVINLTGLKQKNNDMYFNYQTQPFWSDPAWSPDGKYLLCTYHNNGTDSEEKLYVIDMRTKSSQFVIEGHDGDWIDLKQTRGN